MPFTSEELRVVRNLGNMAAAALENVELFHMVRTDQEQLRAILASSSDGIALLGVNACFIEANTAFGSIFGIDPEHIVGMECMELLGCEDEGEDSEHTGCRELCMVHNALQQEEALPYTEVDLTIQGVSRSVGLSFTRVSTKNKPICLMMARDVTAIRDASRMKANFISMITHELRSPLNAINGYLDLALTGVAGELNEQLREFLQRSRSGSEQLYGLVEDLLLVSRADAGQLRLSREVISLNDVITDAVEELELTATDRGIHLAVDIAPDFPQLYADPVRMQQVLRNLISNALRFTSAEGNVTVAATLEYVDGGGEDIEDRDVRIAKLSVRDTGSGIAPEHQQRIFERFYQVPQNTVRVTGQGLGLAIVKMIIELHGGHVTLESIVGQGSTFTCVLPCVLS
jgi:PAS domain S-box-containing protein